jgi:hypothetical protein
MYRLIDGDLVDTDGGTLLSRAEDIDSGLIRLADGRLVLFIWEAGIAFLVADDAESESYLDLYRHGELRCFYDRES